MDHSSLALRTRNISTVLVESKSPKTQFQAGRIACRYLAGPQSLNCCAILSFNGIGQNAVEFNKRHPSRFFLLQRLPSRPDTTPLNHPRFFVIDREASMSLDCLYPLPHGSSAPYRSVQPYNCLSRSRLVMPTCLDNLLMWK